jgi:hypothetical protein
MKTDHIKHELSLGLYALARPNQLGAKCEAMTVTYLRKLLPRKYRVTLHYGQGYDISISDRKTGELLLTIEVKASRKAIDGKYRATTFKENCTDLRKSDVVIMWCVMDGGIAVPYIIPTKILGRKSSVCITSSPEKYSGKYAKYLKATNPITMLTAS